MTKPELDLSQNAAETASAWLDKTRPAASNMAVRSGLTNGVLSALVTNLLPEAVRIEWINDLISLQRAVDLTGAKVER